MKESVKETVLNTKQKEQKREEKHQELQADIKEKDSEIASLEDYMAEQGEKLRNFK